MISLLGKSKVFTKLNITNGYYQVELEESSNISQRVFVNLDNSNIIDSQCDQRVRDFSKINERGFG